MRYITVCGDQLNKRHLQNDSETKDITVKILCDSINLWGNRLTTFELEYPRYIHAELMTHRLFSRNAASSRAINNDHSEQFKWSGPGCFQTNWSKAFYPLGLMTEKPGMQGGEPLDPTQIFKVKCALDTIYETVVRELKKIPFLHKQHRNRYLEPFLTIRTIVTATEYDNFFYLRISDLAQPEIRVLAEAMKAAMQSSTPKLLVDGWHKPYSEDVYEAVAAIARVSYDKAGDTENAKKLYDRLLKNGHMSPFEHIARPITDSEHEAIVKRNSIELKYGNDAAFFGNFRGWVQLRRIIENDITLFT